MKITLTIHKTGPSDREAIEVADEILVEELLGRLFEAQHDQFELFSEALTEPHDRKSRLSAIGIKHGDQLYCRPKRHEVRVHIDEKPYQSPSVTTGIALYELGHVPSGHQLYRAIEGNREDEPIFRDREVFELKQDEHFHSSDKPFHGYEIFVNTEPKLLHKRRLTFDEVVDLAFNPRPTGTDVEFTVLFRHAAGRHHEGTLSPGHVVKIKNGTIFDVTSTCRS